MKRKKNIFTKKRIVNKKRFFLSLILMIGIIFLLSHSIKAIFDKGDSVVDRGILSIASAIKGNKNTPVPNDQMLNDDELTFKKRINDIEEKRKLDKAIAKNNQTEESNVGKNNKKNYNYKEYFKEDLFIGDSLTDSLSFYEIIEDKNVIAKLGLSIINGKDYLNNIIKANPSNIYIMFGMNDILRKVDGAQFAKEYADFIHIIEEKLPESNIYIQSIPPVSPSVKRKKPLLTNENIKKFNEAIKVMCEEENVNYLDLWPIFVENVDLIEPDGIHLKYNFYKLWLDYIIDNVENINQTL